jgi:hypothetical protein
MERTVEDRRNNIDQHKELERKLDILETKMAGIEQEITKLKVHLFYLFLFFQVIVSPLVSKAFNLVFP